MPKRGNEEDGGSLSRDRIGGRMNNINIFDLLITGSGLYLIYVAVIMKTKGEIAKGVIVSRDVDIERMRDKEGFIRYMYGKSLFMGILTAAVGAINMANFYVQGPAWVSIAAVAGYIMVLAAFAVFTLKARKKFID